MAETTKIEWCNHTFNPWIGCQRVAPGCQHCYAEAFAKRTGMAKWGPSGTRVKTSEAYWRQPLKWDRKAEKEGVRRRVFCASMADFFEQWDGPVLDHRGETLFFDAGLVGGVREYAPRFYGGEPGLYARACGDREATLNDIRCDVCTLIDATPNLDWLILTKRVENIRRMLTNFNVCSKCGIDVPHRLRKYCGDGSDKDNEHRWLLSPRPNLWLGCSIATQEDADRNIPLLLECRDLARVLFVSAEPLLGPINFRWTPYHLEATHETYRDFLDRAGSVHQYESLRRLGWVIIGCESGPKRRPMKLDWAKRLVSQCRAAGVACFVKQLSIDGRVSHEPEEWPEELRVRQFPQTERN